LLEPVENYPEIQHAARAHPYPNCLIQIDDKSFTEHVVWFADSDFFKIFQIPFLQGNPNYPLSQPDAVVLTEKLAQKYFGDENPIGKAMFSKSFNLTLGTNILRVRLLESLRIHPKIRI
jgi:putative ABC transport system permease protein